MSEVDHDHSEAELANKAFLKRAFRKQALVASFLLIYGCVGIFVPLLISASQTDALNHIELDPRGVTQIDGDFDGAVYLASSAYNRIQKYDSSGKFMLSWHVDSYGPYWNMSVNDKSNIEVRGGKSDSTKIFDANGRLLNTVPSIAKPKKQLEFSRQLGDDIVTFRVVSLIGADYLTWVEREGVGTRSKVVQSKLHISPPWYFAIRRFCIHVLYWWFLPLAGKKINCCL